MLQLLGGKRKNERIRCRPEQALPILSLLAIKLNRIGDGWDDGQRQSLSAHGVQADAFEELDRSKGLGSFAGGVGRFYGDIDR